MGREWATLTQDFPLSLLHIAANESNWFQDSSKVATQLPSGRINIVKMATLHKASTASMQSPSEFQHKSGNGGACL